MRDVEEDASGEEDDSSHGRGRLHGMRAPAEEYWSDDDSAGGPRTAPAEDASAEAHPRGGPWVAQAQRRLGGPRVDEPVSGRLLARLLVYALAFSACLTVCEVLTMWLSRRVSGALHTGLLTSVLWGAVRCACLCGLPYCFFCAYGLLKHPAVWKEAIPPRRKVLDEMGPTRIIFRHVCLLEDSQPLSQACVAHTVSLLQRTLPEAMTRVELVCEGLPFWEPPATARVLAVPADYAPPAGAVGHARAMQYAAQHGAASGGDWVVYLGAASVLRERTVDAILAHVVDEAHRLAAARRPDAARADDRHSVQYGRIAQGPMCVGQTGGSWMGFLSDTRRAGEAHGILRWQYESSEAWAGVHETFLVVPKELEKVVGFDHGPRATSSNLTLFALLCRDCGARFAWLDAPTEQPAPATALEFMAQRRRAFLSRLSALAASGDGSRGALSTDRRVPLAVLTISGCCAQLCLVVTALSIIIQHNVSISELLVSFIISFCSGTILFCHLLGLATSCSPLSFGGGPVGWVVFLGLLLAQLLWAPVACFLELVACGQALHAHLQGDAWRQR